MIILHIKHDFSVILFFNKAVSDYDNTKIHLFKSETARSNLIVNKSAQSQQVPGNNMKLWQNFAMGNQQSQGSKPNEAHDQDDSMRRELAASRRNSEGLKKTNTACLDRLFQVTVLT